MWFKNLLGFKEENPIQVRNNLILKGNQLISKVNGKTYQCGTLEIPTLAELKAAAPNLENYKEKISLVEVVGDVQQMHQEIANQGALFQAASQFNLLEMVGPSVSPEQGIGIYENDHTQGPACAIACGAGTIYRNYFVELENQIGQTHSKQVDCLEEIGQFFNNKKLQLWQMTNGYALPTQKGLATITQGINNLSPDEYEQLKCKLKIGIQWNTEVTISSNQQTVSQAYCSALPVRYSQIDSKYWESFARLILEATYEATFYGALKNYEETGNRKLFLTLVGGGAFGNELNWIFKAMKESIDKFRKTPLEVSIVSYGRSSLYVSTFVDTINES